MNMVKLYEAYQSFNMDLDLINGVANLVALPVTVAIMIMIWLIVYKKL